MTLGRSGKLTLGGGCSSPLYTAICRLDLSRRTVPPVDRLIRTTIATRLLDNHALEFYGSQLVKTVFRITVFRLTVFRLIVFLANRNHLTDRLRRRKIRN